MANSVDPDHHCSLQHLIWVCTVFKGLSVPILKVVMVSSNLSILSLPLIQEGQLSVSGERMCTILVNRLEDEACPVNVWLGKLTMLDMTPLG